MTSTFTPRAIARISHLSMLALILALAPGRAYAQDNGMDTDGRIHLGPIDLNPKVSWQTEYDDNILRSAAHPVADVISTIGAQTDVRGRLQRIGLTASGAADWVHYSRTITERGANVRTGLKLDFLFNRIVPYASATYTNSRQRVNPEIDTRPRIEELTMAVGGLFKVGGKTGLAVSATRIVTEHDRNAEADGVHLADALNRAADQYTLSFIQEVTQLTRITVTGEMRNDLFDNSSHRNADYMRLTTGFESQGVVRGHARVGIRFHDPQDPNLSESRGVFLSVGTSTTVFDRVQIGIEADRDLVPSYRPDIAYYESYGFGTTISYAVRPSLRLSAMVSRRVADYGPSDWNSVSTPNQAGTEFQMRYGSGINYRLGDAMSLDVSGAYTERTSVLASRRFDGLSLRAGVSHAF